MEINVEKLFAEVLKHLNLHIAIWFYWQLAKQMLLARCLETL